MQFYHTTNNSQIATSSAIRLKVVISILFAFFVSFHFTVKETDAVSLDQILDTPDDDKEVFVLDRAAKQKVGLTPAGPRGCSLTPVTPPRLTYVTSRLSYLPLAVRFLQQPQPPYISTILHFVSLGLRTRNKRGAFDQTIESSQSAPKEAEQQWSGRQMPRPR